MCITIIPPTSLSFPCRRESKRPRRRTGRFYTLSRLTLKRGRGYDRHHHAYSHNSHRLFRRHGDRAAAGFRSELQSGACARRLQTRTVRTSAWTRMTLARDRVPRRSCGKRSWRTSTRRRVRRRTMMMTDLQTAPSAALTRSAATSPGLPSARRRRPVCASASPETTTSECRMSAASGTPVPRTATGSSCIRLPAAAAHTPRTSRFETATPRRTSTMSMPRLLVQGAGVRCENSDYTGCGDWSAFTDPIELDAELKRGSATEDSDSGWVRVAAAPDPEISISGLASDHIKKVRTITSVETWSFNAPNTIWNDREEMMGGIQIDAGEGECTSSFALKLRRLYRLPDLRFAFHHWALC